jgi:hypothetical protein
LIRVVTLLVVIVALAWPALYNGQPFFHTDTSAYLRGADAGIQKFAHRSSPWTMSAQNANTDGGAPQGTSSPIFQGTKQVISGRSPYYGILLYLGELTGDFWFTVLVQASAVVLSITLVARAAGLPTWPAVPIVAALLAAASSAPYYVSLLMPDVFAGVLILGASILLASRSVLRPLDYGMWFLLLSAAMVFHDSHLLIAVGMLVLGIAWNLSRGWGNWRGLLLLAGAVVTAVTAQFLVDFEIKQQLGSPPVRPPFIVARLIADGPGYRFLKASCPGSGFAVCAFIERLPMESNDFLWSPDGVFTGTTPQTRIRLAAEQNRFTVAVLQYDPFGVALAAVRNTARQLTMMGLENFRYGEFGRAIFERKIPAEHLDALRHSAAYRDSMPIQSLTNLNAAGLALAGVFVAWLVIRNGMTMGVSPVAAGLLGWALTGVVLDAAVCGVLSGPHIRYSERVQWLVPLVVMILFAVRHSTRRRDGTVPRISKDSPA